MALAVPSYAQTQDRMSPGRTQAQQNQAQNAGQMPAANSERTQDRDQAQGQYRNGDQGLDQDQAQNEDEGQTTGRHMGHRHAAREGRGYGQGMRPGSLGMDVAPGGGTYTRRDVASEEPGRMSHPVAGERRAPSNVAKGSLANVDRIENDMTARLNQQQLNGNGEMTATLPSQGQEQQSEDRYRNQ